LTSTLERLQGRAYSGQPCHLITLGGRAQRGHLHFQGTNLDRFVFVCENGIFRTFDSGDVVGISKSGNRITIRQRRQQ
jgi:hypothetical protein